MQSSLLLTALFLLVLTLEIYTMLSLLPLVNQESEPPINRKSLKKGKNKQKQFFMISPMIVRTTQEKIIL